MGIDEDDRERQLTEAHRVVDQQIETARAYEERAGELFKVLLTTVGISLSLLLLLSNFFGGDLSFTSLYQSTLELETLRMRNEQGISILSPPLSSQSIWGIAVLLTMSLTIGLLAIVLHLLGTIEDVAEGLSEIFEPGEFQAGIRPESGHIDQSIERYAWIIQSNHRRIATLRQAWEEYLNAIFSQLNDLGALFFCFSLLLTRSPYATVYASIATILWAFFVLKDEDRVWEYVDSGLVAEPTADLLAFVEFGLLMLIWANPPSPIGAIALVLAAINPFLIVSQYVQLTSHRIRRLAIRNTLLTVLTFAGMVVHALVVASWSYWDHLIFAVLTYGFFVSLGLAALSTGAKLGEALQRAFSTFTSDR